MPRGNPTRVVRLPESLVDHIDALAERKGLSRAEVVEEAVTGRKPARAAPAAGRCDSCGVSLAHARPLHAPGCRRGKKS